MAKRYRRFDGTAVPTLNRYTILHTIVTPVHRNRCRFTNTIKKKKKLKYCNIVVAVVFRIFARQSEKINIPNIKPSLIHTRRRRRSVMRSA